MPRKVNKIISHLQIKKADHEGKCGEGKCGAKGDMKKNMEGQCGGKKAEQEGKCGEGKCGSSNKK